MDFTEKQIPPLLLLSTRTKLGSVPEIPPYAQKTVPAVFGKAKELGLEIAGPEMFIYHFHEKGPDHGMELCIGIPVKAAKGDPGAFEFFTTPAVKVISAIYPGSMQGICHGWEALDNEVKRRGLACTVECREVYLVWKDFDSADNRTELQKIIKS